VKTVQLRFFFLVFIDKQFQLVSTFTDIGKTTVFVQFPRRRRILGNYLRAEIRPMLSLIMKVTCFVWYLKMRSGFHYLAEVIPTV
jgi:hypothetical protein